MAHFLLEKQKRKNIVTYCALYGARRCFLMTKINWNKFHRKWTGHKTSDVFIARNQVPVCSVKKVVGQCIMNVGWEGVSIYGRGMKYIVKNVPKKERNRSNKASRKMRNSRVNKKRNKRKDRMMRTKINMRIHKRTVKTKIDNKVLKTNQCRSNKTNLKSHSQTPSTYNNLTKVTNSL